jgi:hypothetical protein
VARVARTRALLRYPFTALLPGEAMGGQRVLDDLPGYARRKAAFVRVLDGCLPLHNLSDSSGPRGAPSRRHDDRSGPVAMTSSATSRGS